MRALIMAFALAACAAQQPATTNAPSLAGTSWMRIDRGEDAPHFPTLAFEGERASGHAGCNRWFAAVTRSGGQLSFAGIGATRMMCPEPAMATERAFLDALTATRSARIENRQLVLLDAEGRELARFDSDR
jgi:heat shock protein HslJ